LTYAVQRSQAQPSRDPPPNPVGPRGEGEVSMREVPVPTQPAEGAFRYYCPVCGIELTAWNYQTPDADYYCPYCGTQQRPTRVLSL
jgi:predicted RNA-binding Zn-ribbon protein involved in translation (DUF1610 family)